MSQHFLLSARARTMSLGMVARMGDAEVETAFKALRWPATQGKPVCPNCECATVYECRRPSGALRFRCKACRGDFSITSGTLFAFHKMPLRSYLMAVAIFANEVKGKSALALSRDLGTQYKTAYVLARKLREAMAPERRGCSLAVMARSWRSMAAISADTSNRQTAKPAGELPGSRPCEEPERQALGRGRDARAGRQLRRGSPQDSQTFAGWRPGGGKGRKAFFL